MDRRGFLSGAISGATAFAGAQAEQSKGEMRFCQWAIVEMMGYKQLAGRLSQGFAGLLQLDIPVEGGMVTQMINPNSIYRVTYVDEAVVRASAKRIDPLPAIELEVPPRQKALVYVDTYEPHGRDDDF